jgi:hypothetical protein
MSDRAATGFWALAGSALLAGSAMFGMSASALANGGPDIKTDVSPLPPTVTLASSSQPTYASYVVTLTSQSYSALQPVSFTATTAVVGATQDATFFAPSLPAGCTAPTTVLTCTFSAGLAHKGQQIQFTVAVKVPTAGTSITFTATTSWRNCGRNYSAPASASTTLAAPDPNSVASYVPASGGELVTGKHDGMATPDDPWTTTVTLPAAALGTTAVVQEQIDASPYMPNLLNTSSSTLTIPGTFDDLVIVLRRDASTIARGAKIASAIVRYTEPAHPAAGVVYPLQVPSCSDTTYGTLPRSGVPCISMRKAYPTKDDCDHSGGRWGGPKITVTPGYEGDWEFTILAVDNGRYIN